MRYQHETQSNIEHKEKKIQQLSDNGKCLVSEIQRMKDEIDEGEVQRQQLIIDNNELQKQVMHENVVIPKLESELKCLSEENDYLKLLGKFRMI